MDRPSVSVLTPVKGRERHLRRLLAGLARGTRRPDRAVVVDMGEAPPALPPCPFPVTHHRMPSPGLPLAAARNAAARLAGTPLLVFLDVDCIPAANLVEALAAAAQAEDALVCCEIRYLPAAALPPEEDAPLPPEAALLAAGRPHRDRPFPASGRREEANAGLFWSLAFAVRRATFERIGGFDESFTGYGAEDTDLSFRARAAGVPLLLTGDTRAFHQHHTVRDPPLQHFADILANAQRFRARHGLWPMDGWLHAFARMGLIAPLPAEGARITILRAPTEAELRAAICPPDRVY
ncbi:glycosyltransferase [Roseomonas sp. OT10]|uniref:glycosyltransferase family 2 protein n=1 Tax=Roseomonas cutis TaxID=2897332 RepID=UPI001E57793F|nr:glycosyltransferase [Roseomonas sp. OT10]UFN48939.1 glycosyltransferase [Roseomonas sp. OT10]